MPEGMEGLSNKPIDQPDQNPLPEIKKEGQLSGHSLTKSEGSDESDNITTIANETLNLDETIQQDAQLAAETFSQYRYDQQTIAVAIEILMKSPKTKEGYQEALTAAKDYLQGMTGMLVTHIGKDGTDKLRFVLSRDNPIGRGYDKKCHIAIRLGGKDASAALNRPANYKSITTYSSTGIRGYANEMLKSKNFSEKLRSDPDTKDLFMNYKTVRHGNQVVLMGDYADGGDLFEKLVVGNSWQNDQERTEYCEDLLKAGAALERAGVCHRDLKPENIFIKNEKIVVGDFGATKEKGQPPPPYQQGTPGYIPPRNQDMDTRQDPFAIGMILLTISTYTQLNANLVNKEGSDYPDDTRLNNLCAHLRLADPDKYPMASIILSLISTDKDEQNSSTEAMEKFKTLKQNAEAQGNEFNPDLYGLIEDAGGLEEIVLKLP